MRSVAFILALMLTVSSAVTLPRAAQNGQVVGKCNDKTELGSLACSGKGFTTCTHRGLIFRDCDPGTACTASGSHSILCAPEK